MKVEKMRSQQQNNGSETKRSHRRCLWYAFLLVAVAASTAQQAQGMPQAFFSQEMRSGVESIVSERFGHSRMQLVDSAERVVAPEAEVAAVVSTGERSVAVHSVSTTSTFVIGANPVRGPTTIGFTLPRSGHTTLTLLNAEGTTIATLLEKDLASGSHRIEWNATGIEKGVYILMLRNDGYIETDMVEVVPLRTRSRGVGAFRP